MNIANLKTPAGYIDFTAADMADALEQAFIAEYGRCTSWEPPAAVRQQAETLAERNRSWEWLYGRTPPFDVTTRNRFAWGSLELNFRLEHGQIAAAAAFSDAMEPELILALRMPRQSSAAHASSVSSSM